MILTLLKLCFGIVLIVTAINGDSLRLIEMLEQLVDDNQLINGLFRPLSGGYINEGTFGTVFQGIRVSDNLTVAMKFSHVDLLDLTDREYAMYTFLNAINNTDIEHFGFSAIYYYNEWNEQFMLTVFSYFDDGDAFDKLTRTNHFYHPLNSLILFRDFVRQSKYMHSHGVRHDDIKPENIMFRKHRSFLIDFNMSANMKRLNNDGTMEYSSRKRHSKQLRTALDDWESFLYTMCSLNKIELEWMVGEPFAGLNHDEALKVCGKMKKRTKNTVAKIKRSHLEAPLKRIFLTFADEVFKNKGVLPNYNRMHGIINDEIGNLLKPNESALFTWLSHEEKAEAVLDLAQNPLDITNIDDPLTDFNSFRYPDIDFEFFDDKMDETIEIERNCEKSDGACEFVSHD